MMRPVLIAALALAIVSAASPSTPGKTIGTRGKVVEISADGGNAAIHAALAGDPDCNSGSVWTPASGKVVRFEDTPCGKKADDLQYDSLTLAGSRAAWTDYDFGNHAYCSGPYTATLTSPEPADLGIECDPAGGVSDVYLDFAGDGDLLVARSYLLCEGGYCSDFDPPLADGEQDVTIWRIDSGAKRIVEAKKDTKLLDVDAGRILLLEPPGTLIVVDGSGKTVAKVALGKGAVDGAKISGTQIVARKGLALTVYKTSGTASVKRTMASGGKLQDVENGVAVYIASGAIHLLWLTNGRDKVVATVKGLVEADLEPSGLFYAYNVPGGGEKPGRVTFVPSSSLPK